MAAPLPPHATPGNVVGERYVLDAVIGRGGMGVVMSARHITLGKRVAVKLLLAEADENARARFELEAQAAAVIASPHIAQVLDFGVTRDGLAYLVMEYLEGRDLQVEKRLRVRLPIMEAVDVVLEASVGIAQAHAAGLVHRDIKPANVFLAQIAGRRVVKVLDFGLIKVMSEGAAGLTGTTETFGTPKYMAPEQLRSARSVDARADQHALAAILFEMITGRPPFDGESVPDIIIKIGTEPAPLASSVGVAVPPPLESALQRAMAKRADQRFPSLSEFAAAIAPFGTARAAELSDEIARCLASTIGRRPLSQDELRSTAQMPRPAASSAGQPSLGPTTALGVVMTPSTSLAAASLPTASPVVGASMREPMAAHEASASRSGAATLLVAPGAPSPPGSSTLSSSSVETFRNPRPTPAPSTNTKAVGLAAIAALVAVGALVFALSRGSSAPTGPSAMDTQRGARAASEPSSPAIASSVVETSAAPAVSAAPAIEPSASASIALTPSAAPSTMPKASAAPLAPRPTLTPPRTPVPPPQRPCASLDCLGN